MHATLGLTDTDDTTELMELHVYIMFS